MKIVIVYFIDMTEMYITWSTHSPPPIYPDPCCFPTAPFDITHFYQEPIHIQSG